MCSLFRWTSTTTAMLAFGLTAATVTPIMISALASAQVPAQTPTTPTEQAPTTPTTPTDQAPTTPATTSFFDVSQDYWAQPFIQALAARNVIVGFPDGTFRPNQPVTRAQFAAMIQKAFNQNPVRQLSSGGFTDVPSNYWAAAAIQEAYETGFMSGYPGNVFRPNQQIPKVEAIVALTSGLGLSASGTTSDVLTNYYTDASAIPNYAVNNVTAATSANLVVNYPDVKVLNPQASLSRAEAAAHLYQALVRLGQVQPLASNVVAAQYIVGGVGQTTAGTQTTNDIVSLAASSNSFTTLTSLLKTAGLAEALQQQGPFTVFAPTDEAFNALPKEALQRLQQPENKEALVKILTYHVVAGQITSAGEQKTLEGGAVNIRIAGEKKDQIRVNNANVIQPVEASNGIIYAVDRVLLPPDFRLSQLQPGGGTGDTGDTGIGRATRGGRSYIGVAGNIGLGGDSALSEGNFTVISKLGLTNFLSVRPSVVIGDDPVVLVPISFDLFQRSVSPLGGGGFTIAPYLGAGVAIETSDDADIGFLLTGGVDVPLGTRFTVTGSVNAAFLDETDVGLVLGIGYNF